MAMQRVAATKRQKPAIVNVTALPTPLDYKRISLLDRNSHNEPITYTDCMESSVLRFVQMALCDVNALKKSGQSSRIDLELVRARVTDPDVLAFFERYPCILPADAYNSGSGKEAREAWARLVTKRPFFTYKRSTTGVYKNSALMGEEDTPAEGFEWQLEMEPCIHNIVNVCRHFLGCRFEREDELLRKAGKRHGLPLHPEGAPFSENFGEAQCTGAPAQAQGHVDAMLRQLSRPGMELQGRLSAENTENIGEDCPYFYVNLDLALNGAPAWKWVLTRVLLGPRLQSPYNAGCPRDQKGEVVFVTSAHSHIEEASE